jgi:hypothetical protein
MTSKLPTITPTRKIGTEPFYRGGQPMPFDITSFWQWAMSDLVGNTARGVLAEYIVARALGLAGDGIRPEWSAYDLELPGPPPIKIEVKSAAYIQSWEQADYSKISYTVAKKRGWDPVKGYTDDPKRHADVYVLALLAHKDQETLDSLNVDQWQFHVVPTGKLDERERSQHSITLPSLQALRVVAVPYDELLQAVRLAAGQT